ncbi:MAG: CaiB/BaiF CoA transferase family protein [Sphingomonadaceae bacterium]
MTKPTGPLAGMKVLEIAGIGPGPFSGMILAEMGADVVVVDRIVPNAENLEIGAADVTSRGKRSLAVDLKSPNDVALVLDLVEKSEALIEGMRPGVMERLGLGPEICLARNPALVYGRMTGWGQDGPLSHAAGHDLNYIALSGALWYSGQPGEPPLAPPSLVGDVGGGALYLVVGILAAVMNARKTGMGQVVDAAIVDGSAHMLHLLLSLHAAGQMVNDRGKSILEGPHWYSTYRCADGDFVTVGALEPKFYYLLREKLGLLEDSDFDNGQDAARWPELRQRMADLFASRSRAQWCELLEGTDVCFAPVFNPDEAACHPHMTARGIYQHREGVMQAAPAPRFSGTPSRTEIPIPRKGEHRDEVLAQWLQR